MEEYEYKIELTNSLNILWKRKWIVIISTATLIIVAALISFLLPPRWEVDVIFWPSKLATINEQGYLVYIPFVDQRQIDEQINRGAYNNMIADALHLDIKEFPKLKADVPINTQLVRISIIEKNVEKSKLILDTLVNYLKTKLDYVANTEIKRVDSQIESKTDEKLILEGEIRLFNNRLNIIKQRNKEIEKEMSDLRKRIEELEEARHVILKKKNRSESENIIILIYSNEIIQNSINHNTLNELLGNKKNEEEAANLEIKNKKRLMNQIENEINELNERKSRIHYTEITKEPTSSISPVLPKKLFNILISIPLGLIISIMLAFFFEYIEKQKVTLRR